jgi:hypothetical protein
MGRLIARERDNRDWLALQVRLEAERTVQTKAFCFFRLLFPKDGLGKFYD